MIVSRIEPSKEGRQFIYVHGTFVILDLKGLFHVEKCAGSQTSINLYQLGLKQHYLWHGLMVVGSALEYLLRNYSSWAV